jgi:glycerol-3-phosphate dehydrogenase
LTDRAATPDFPIEPVRSTAVHIGRHDLAALERESFDLVVIGGGITGAGVARHAAQTGLRTLLVEAADFASGTSSRSTKLIHGGLRYLAMGDFALVREGALERKSLVAIAPHLAEPRWMLVPAATYAGYWKLRIGIGLYERLGEVAGAERHRNLHGDPLGAVEPMLDAHRLPWACRYREYLTDDARLVIATLRAAARDGATIANHAAVESLARIDSGCAVGVHDGRTGGRHVFRARAVVNAAGPWVETLLGSAGEHRRRLYLSKGVHVVVERTRLPVQNMVMMTATDGRPVFAIARDGVTYIGTTDTPHDGPPDRWPVVRAGEVDYLLATANVHFPAALLTRGDVRATWAGLRPLIHQAGKAPKEMSRRDEIWRDGPLVTIAGGKLTGFRKMAEQTMAEVARVLGRTLDMPAPLAPVPGGERADVDALAAEVAARYDVGTAVGKRLTRLYGAEVFAVLGQRPTALSASVFAEEVRWAVAVEGAHTLEDVLYRRLRAAWYLPGEITALVEPCAALMAPALCWDAARVAREIAETRARLEAELVFA